MDYYLVFYSTHHLLQAERLCQGEGIPITLVPIPREITSECGMAIKFAEPYLDQIVAVVSRAGLAHRGIFRLGPRGPTKIA